MSTLYTPWVGLSNERPSGEDGGGGKGNNKKETRSNPNSLASRHVDLLVLRGVLPVVHVELFTFHRDFSLFVVGSVDDVINESARASLAVLFVLSHVHGHLLVVAEVLVALSRSLVEGRAHGNNTL
jgi:hypothetical protein